MKKKSNQFAKKVFFQTLLLFILSQVSLFAQNKKNFTSNDDSNKSVVMTWNKNTPEEEMNDDIKALKQSGVTISYGNLKRNEKGEIIALKITYTDEEGNSGSQEYNGKNPIDTIRFHKNKNSIGFGSSNNIGMAFEDFDWNNSFGNQFHGGMDLKKMNPNGFNFSGKSESQSKSKIIIKKDGKKPLVIEDGKVIEGGEGYTEEELNDLKKGQEFNKEGFKFNFDSDNLNNSDQDQFSDLKAQIEKMQKQIEKLMPEAENKDQGTEKSDPDSKKKKENTSNTKESKKKESEAKTYKI
jgi:hypothetical protein